MSLINYDPFYSPASSWDIWPSSFGAEQFQGGWGYGQLDPFREMRRMSRELSRLTSGGVGGEGKGVEVAPWRPVWDIKETDKGMIVHVELPGVKKEDIKVEVNEGLLTISGERNQEKHEEGATWRRSERSYGQFCRSIPLGEGITEKDIKANFQNGVLELNFPKPKREEAQLPKRIAIS